MSSAQVCTRPCAILNLIPDTHGLVFYRMLCCYNRLLARTDRCPLQFVLDRSVSADGWQGQTD
jgi:hypothetical protein